MCYTKKTKMPAALSFQQWVWAKDSRVFLAHRSSTLPAHEPRRASVQWTANLARFSCCQWFMDLRRLSLISLMSIHEMLAYCRWRNAWCEAISCCFPRPCCFGHSEIFQEISKNESSCSDLWIWKSLEMNAGSDVFQMQALAFFKILRFCMTTTGTNFLYK